ncbi:MAG: biosynthetic-type acetolactate synthase large subunit [Dehalococcoidia bacterium]|nr:biosynthetic-type acetolactate synthase large subunit [Dehalococcoidia bacterium]
MNKTGAQILCDSLVKEGVEVIFGILGGALLPLYDILPQYPQIRHILTRHEQGAVHAAEGYARATGRVGVCIATSGPGATNLVTGIADAYMDSVPLVAITGQVATPFIGKDAFQETDITGITLPITKYNYLVTDVTRLAEIVKEAFHIAQTGRPGPVLIDIPKDVLQAVTNFVYPEKVNLPSYKITSRGHMAQIRRAVKLIDKAERPLIIAGRGILISRAWDELKLLAEKAQIPVVSTLLGLSSFPGRHILNFGMLGMHGMAYANLAVQNADLVIAIGMRFDDRATANTDDFAPLARIIHIDIDPAEISKNVPADVPIVGDVKAVLNVLNKEVGSNDHLEWVSQLGQWKYEYPLVDLSQGDKLLPQYIVEQICEVTQGDTVVVTGVGQHQMWAAQHFTYTRLNSFISAGGLGPMGFGLPAAMGARIGLPEETVWCIDGDGSFQMNIQELGTIAQERIAIKIAIMNNGFLGMVRQWQEMFYHGRYVHTKLWNPDFVKIAEAYDIPGIRVKHKEEVVSAINRAMDCPGPFLLDFAVEPEENVYPMVSPGENLAKFIDTPRPEVLSK